MAVTSGQVNTNTTYDSYFWVKWSQKGTQDIANNRTTINWSCGVYCGHSFYLNAIRMSAVTINGSQVYRGGTYSNYGVGNHTIASGTLVITHNSDGNKSFSISSFTGWLYANNNYSSSGRSFVLPQIPRISKPTLSVSTVNFGGSVTIYTNRKSDSFTHKLWYKYGTTGWIEITSDASVATSYAWTISKDLMKNIPNALSLDITIGCDTYYNGSFIGKDYAYLKATVPDTTDCYPSIANIVWAKTSSEPASWPITQNVSKGTMSITGAAGAYNSTIKSYSLTFAGLSSTSASLTVNNIASSGTLQAVAKVTDTRGRTTEKSVSFIVASYEKPVVSVKVYRSNASGVEDEIGDYMYVKASVTTISSVGDNSIGAITLKYKRHTLSTYTTETLTSDTAKIVSASSDYTWDWIVTVADKVSTVTFNGSIATGEVVLDILANGKGIGIGKVAEYENVIDTPWNFKFGDNTQTDVVVEVKTSGIWTYRKWSSGIAECWGLYSITGAAITNAWGYLFETANNYQVNFPSGLFIANPVANFFTPTATGGILAIETLGETTKDKTCSFFPVRATAQTLDLTVAIQAIGRWK